MDVLPELIHSKFESSLTHNEWKAIGDKVLASLLSQHDMHEDERLNWDSYINEMCDMIQDRFVVYYETDEKDMLYTLRFTNVHFVRPFESGHGVDDPERAMSRGDYTSQARGIAHLQISKKGVQSMDDLLDEEEALDEAESVEEDDGVDEEEEEFDDDSNDEEEDEEDEEEEDDNDSEKVKKKKCEKKAPDFTYSHDKYKDYTIIVHETFSTDCHILDLPIPIRSELCHLTHRYVKPTIFAKKAYTIPGLYAVNRYFRVYPSEEENKNNIVLTKKKEDIEIRSRFVEPSKKYRTNCTLNFTVQMRRYRKNSQSDWVKHPRFLFQIPRKKNTYISATVLAMIYGWQPSEFRELIHSFLLYDDRPAVIQLLDTIERDTQKVKDHKDAVLKLAKYADHKQTERNDILSYMNFMLHSEYFPHLFDLENENLEFENIRKGYLIAEAISRLIYMHDIYNRDLPPHKQHKPDDLRSYVYQRLSSSGEAMASLLRKHIKFAIQQNRTTLKKELSKKGATSLNRSIVANPKRFTITKSVKNGTYDAGHSPSESNKNKTQMLITGFSSDSAHLQGCIVTKYTPPKGGFNVASLLPHATQAGRVGLRTPESDHCGKVRHRSLGSYLTPLTDLTLTHRNVMSILKKQGLVEVGITKEPKDMREWFLVKDVWGGVMGWCKEPLKVRNELVKRLRRSHLHPFLEVQLDQRYRILTINEDPNRLVRPLIIASQVPKLIDIVSQPYFDGLQDQILYLKQKGCIEYLGAAEEYSGFCWTAPHWEAFQKQNFTHTHLEIHLLTALSLTTARPYCNNNQIPRMMGTGNMDNRAIGYKMWVDKGTTVCYSLAQSHKPIVSDPINQHRQLRQWEPHGVNVVVAILSDGSMEDCVSFKRTIKDMGQLDKAEYSIKTAILNVGHMFVNPTMEDDVLGMKSVDTYKGLQPNGLPRKGTVLKGGMAWIGRIFKHRSSVQPRCISQFVPFSSEYIVDKVECFPPYSEQPTMVKVTMCTRLSAFKGDKFCFGQGQKFTVGDFVNHENQFFISGGPPSLLGITPDVIVNTHSMSRGTIGLQREMIASLARCLNPDLPEYDYIMNHSSECDLRHEEIKDILFRNQHCKESRVTMSNGNTGEMLNCTIFTGVAHMRVLKQLAKEKHRARFRGPRDEYTRQTSVGKKKGGGMRHGEMEYWNTYSYGGIEMMRDHNFHSADKFHTVICTKCHNINAMGNIMNGGYICQTCKSDENVRRVYYPYVSNIVQHETLMMGLGLIPVLEDVKPEEMESDPQKIYYKHQ